MRRAILPLFLVSGFSFAATLPYQGLLTDLKGNPVTDQKYSLDIKVYGTASGGSPLWEEERTTTTTNGLFSINLGDSTPIPEALLSQDSLFLGLSVAGKPELTPRTRLGAVMRSILSTYADTAKFARNALGLVDTGAFRMGMGAKVDTAQFTIAMGTKLDTSFTRRVAAISDSLGLETTLRLGGYVDTAAYRAGIGTKVDTASLTAGLGGKVDTATFSINSARIDSIRIKLNRYPDSIAVTSFLGAQYKGKINPDSLKAFESGYSVNADANIPWEWAIYQSLSPYNSSSIQLAARSCTGCGSQYALRTKDDNNASGKWSNWNTLWHTENLNANTLPGGPYIPNDISGMNSWTGTQTFSNATPVAGIKSIGPNDYGAAAFMRRDITNNTKSVLDIHTDGVINSWSIDGGLQTNSITRIDGNGYASLNGGSTSSTFRFGNSGNNAIAAHFNPTTMDPIDYYLFAISNNDALGVNRLSFFQNGSNRTDDEGPNAVVLRNDNGPLVLGGSGGVTTIAGNSVNIRGPVNGTNAFFSGNAQFSGMGGISLGSTGVWSSSASSIGSGWPTIWGTNDQKTGNPYIMIPSPHIPYMQANKFLANEQFRTAEDGGSRIRFASDATAGAFGDFGILPENANAFTSTLPIIGTDASFTGKISEGGSQLSAKYHPLENQRLSTQDIPNFAALQRHHEAQNHAPSETVYTKILSIDVPVGSWDWFTTSIIINRGYIAQGSATLAVNISNHNGNIGPYTLALTGCFGFTPDQFILSKTSASHADIWIKDYGSQALIDWSFINYRGISNVTRYDNTPWQTEAPLITATADYGSNAFLSLQGGTLTGSLNGTSASFSGDLHVKTVKIAAGEIPASNVADYVFEPDYRLAPLSEVEAYTKEHKHLPEIPSATEIEKGGLDLAQMNLLLLKKVEELTLHAIAQEKRLQDMQEQIKALR